MPCPAQEHGRALQIGVRKRLVRTLTAFAVAVCSVAALAACSGGPGSGDVATTYPSGVASANRIISEYRSWIGVDGKRRDAIHQGIDIGGPFSQPIIAVADGRVIETHTDRCWGPTVAIDHGSDTDGQPLIALYGHVDDILVEEGQTVSRGDVVARLGNNHHGFRCIGGVRHLHLQLGRERRVNKGSYWGAHILPAGWA